MKLFGKELFSAHKPELYDFAQHGLLTKMNNRDEDEISAYVVMAGETAPGKKDKKDKKPEITPKGLFATKTLNIPEFEIVRDRDYVEGQISILESKLELLPARKKKRGKPSPISFIESRSAVEYGRLEVESMIVRLKNRLNEGALENFNQWPYTNNNAIRDALKEHGHLRCKRGTEFIPDLPKEAIEQINQYTQLCLNLCGQRPVTYLIAHKRDFGEVDAKRDPVLLAQSPFGFFWQILGAWDEEMILLEEL